MDFTCSKKKEYLKQYAIKNAEKIAKQRKEYRSKNSDRIREEKKKYAIENADRLKQKRKADYLANREAILAKQKAARERNLESAREKAREKYHATKHERIEKLREYSRKRQPLNNETKKKKAKERRANDPSFLAMGRIRCRIRSALNGYGWEKNKSTGEMLGCTKEEFARHIEKQFKDGMSWNNRKDWHIDHIIPLSSARSIDELQQLNHHSNLRPMWALDNLKKGSRHERPPHSC